MNDREHNNVTPVGSDGKRGHIVDNAHGLRLKRDAEAHITC